MSVVGTVAMIRVTRRSLRARARWRSPPTHQSRGIGELLGRPARTGRRSCGASARFSSRPTASSTTRSISTSGCGFRHAPSAAPVRLRARRRLHGTDNRIRRRTGKSCTRAGSRDSLIDCRTDDLQGAARFWSGALGIGAPRSCRARKATATCKLQGAGRVACTSRCRRWTTRAACTLDIEADDIEAEVKRSRRWARSGLKNVRAGSSWRRRPGQRFCVVRPQQPRLRRESNTWA